mgnify:CR=1 FL=1
MFSVFSMPSRCPLLSLRSCFSLFRLVSLLVSASSLFSVSYVCSIVFVPLSSVCFICLPSVSCSCSVYSLDYFCPLCFLCYSYSLYFPSFFMFANSFIIRSVLCLFCLYPVCVVSMPSQCPVLSFPLSFVFCVCPWRVFYVFSLFLLPERKQRTYCNRIRRPTLYFYVFSAFSWPLQFPSVCPSVRLSAVPDFY